MTTFTISESNEIVAFPTPEEASASTATPFDSFSREQELAELVASWPTERLIELWNSLPGVTRVKKFTSRETAVKRIWIALQGLGDGAEPKPEDPSEKLKTERKAKGRAEAAKGASAKGKSTKKATPSKSAPKAQKGGKPREGAPREVSKMAQVIALLQRKNGATLDHLASTFQWEKHTVRGMIAGALKKAGYKVDSYKDEKTGARTYRIDA
jgi:hypothetical protein